MKIIAIGDLHGKDCWKQIDQARFDKIIFIGDYVDAKDGKIREVIIENLKSILAFKKQLPEKVVLLLGKHDIQYLHYPAHRCSGFDGGMQPQLTRIFNEHKSEFQIAWQRGNHLFVHAGISRSYFARLNAMVGEKIKHDSEMPLADYLNRLHESKPDLVCVCGATRGGFYPYGGPRGQIYQKPDSITSMDIIKLQGTAGFLTYMPSRRVGRVTTVARSPILMCWIKVPSFLRLRLLIEAASGLIRL